MNKKENLVASINKREIKSIPWTIYASYPPYSSAERRFRNEGLVLIYQHFPICKVDIPEVEIKDESTYSVNKNKKSGKNTTKRFFTTKFGQVTVQHDFFNDSMPTPGDLIQRFGSDTDQESLSWVTEHPFKTEADYEVLKYIYRKMEFKDNSQTFLFTDNLLGEDGYVFGHIGKSPFQIMMYELMGAENCYLEYYSNPKKFRQLFETIYQKTKEKFQIVADSAAEVIWSPENLTSVLTPPYIFEEFYLPFYNEMADILHQKGKIFAVHMDGSLSALSDLIAKTKIDIIEAFTPLPMNDMSVKDALRKWEEKVIWINFPGTVLANYDYDSVKQYTLDLIGSTAPGDRFIIGCTESFPFESWEMSFAAISEALKEKGKYPIR